MARIHILLHIIFILPLKLARLTYKWYTSLFSCNFSYVYTYTIIVTDVIVTQVINIQIRCCLDKVEPLLDEFNDVQLQIEINMENEDKNLINLKIAIWI